MKVWQLLLIILVVIIGVLVALYFLGKRAQKKQDERQQQIDAAKQTTSMLIIEQNLVKALQIADRGYVLETGKITLAGESQELLANPDVRKAYLGIA